MYDYTDKPKSIVDEKIELLYDFCKLRHRKGGPDSREDAVRRLLEACGNEQKMQIVLHDVLMGRINLSALLKKKGLV